MQEITIKDYLDTRLRPYSAHSNVRGIPFIGDGLKEASRKALWGIIKRGEGADLDTVERIAAYAASATDYHHGIGSMQGTIVNLAQDFAGSNNIPLLDKKGQFGNRLNKDPSAARYIKAKLSKTYREMCRRDDDLILTLKHSNGMNVEPKFFIPLLPLVLVNGAEGMGTGHATNIRSYNPNELKHIITNLLDGKPMCPAGTLVPWWNGFKGEVSRDKETGQITVSGVMTIEEKRGGLVVNVTELPVGTQSDKYEETLRGLEEKGLISNYDNRSGEKNGFDFLITVPKGSKLVTASDEELLKHFKLVSRDTENLTVWNAEGTVQRFDSTEDLLKAWFDWRLGLYEVRRLKLIENVKDDIAWSNTKIRFIGFYLANTQKFKNLGKKELIELVLEADFPEYDDLLKMPIWNLTKDKIAELEKERDELIKKQAALEGDTAPAMYKRDLKEFKFTP